jgi:hypothetical protein
MPDQPRSGQRPRLSKYQVENGEDFLYLSTSGGLFLCLRCVEHHLDLFALSDGYRIVGASVSTFQWQRIKILEEVDFSTFKLWKIYNTLT